jgi:hypothetical protein
MPMEIAVRILIVINLKGEKSDLFCILVKKILGIEFCVSFTLVRDRTRIGQIGVI